MLENDNKQACRGDGLVYLSHSILSCWIQNWKLQVGFVGGKWLQLYRSLCTYSTVVQ